jgi:SAM-dependent methyltransferase
MEKAKPEYFETNKQTWNKKVQVHTQSDFYKLDDFVKGASSLNGYELDALGDVTGKSLLHLQCHFGQDTLSWARLGAQCTGIDFSDEGIAFAKALSEKINVPADFVCCNVLDTSHHISQTFDIVLASYGTIGWLPDLKPWGKMIAERLMPGGTFYIIDFHPIAWMFDYTSDTPRMQYGYHQDQVIYEEYEGTYADNTSRMVSKEYGWNHGIAEVVTALIDAGLRVESLQEYDASPYDVLPHLVKQENGLYVS